MNAEWVNWDSTPATASQGSTDRADYSKGFRYFGNPEDGARVTKGWFQVVPGSYLDEGDYNDDSENWYYADKDGKLVAGEMKTINGKKYAFKESGAMVDGYKFIKLASDKKTIVDIVDNDVDDKTPTITGVPEAWENTIIGEQDSWKFDTTDGFKKHAFAWELSGYELYYFGSGDDGAMKTNKANMTIDGDSHSFLFNKSGSYKGAGKTGIDNKKYYQSGMLLTAEKEDKYAVVATLSKSGKIVAAVTLTTDEFLNDVMKVGNTASADGKFTELYDVASKVDEFKADGIEFNLVNTSGTVQKNKEKAKDGNDRCYKVNASGKITSVFVEK
uniref:hypothetical protein n=1 Tax=Clostridium sp. NkU-1 TaxID=1095009 RepID=UPI0032605C42